MEQSDLISFDINEDIEQKQIQLLQIENARLTDEFNVQRAKMKELFLQKEAEVIKLSDENDSFINQIKQLQNDLDDVKNQLVIDSLRLETDFVMEKRKAEEEIASLQRLVHETVEESSSARSLYDEEFNKLKSYIQNLQKDITNLQRENSRYKNQVASYTNSSGSSSAAVGGGGSGNQELSLAPSAVINACKGLAKKLGGDAFSSQDDKIIDKTPQDDVELLKSLVEPLEDQIKALKEKLRSADDQLQKCAECSHDVQNKQLTNRMLLQNTSTNTSFENNSFQQKNDNFICDMCSNYEAQLVKEQQNVKDLMIKLQASDKASERHKEELLKEIGFRKEMEEKWNEKREEHKQQVQELTKILESTENDMKELHDYFIQTNGDVRNQLAELIKERDIIIDEIQRLEKENEHLVGKYTIHSQQFQNQAINLPNTVEELQELVLKNHEELIIAKIGKEKAEEITTNLKSDLLLNKELIESLSDEVNTLKNDVERLDKEKQQFLIRNNEIIEKETRLNELEVLNTKLETHNNELKTRVHSLQQELETTETVQRDFVKLSQSLQIQLEKIRESDNQVRWQHDEDVDECPMCHIQLINSKKKQHCKHCGQIFCINCLSRSVQSGPNLRPSKVCDVCHTILVKSSAPYFSKEPPVN